MCGPLAGGLIYSLTESATSNPLMRPSKLLTLNLRKSDIIWSCKILHRDTDIPSVSSIHLLNREGHTFTGFALLWDHPRTVCVLHLLGLLNPWYLPNAEHHHRVVIKGTQTLCPPWKPCFTHLPFFQLWTSSLTLFSFFMEKLSAASSLRSPWIQHEAALLHVISLTLTLTSTLTF